MKKRRGRERERDWVEKGARKCNRDWLTRINRHSAPHFDRSYPERGNCSVAYHEYSSSSRSPPSALFASLCTDIIGMKLNLYHVEYLTSHRSERLSINQQRSSAVLIDNPRAECIESERAEGEGENGYGGGLGCERVRVFGSDGPVSASTYNILYRSISATPFSLSVRLATFRKVGGWQSALSERRGRKSRRDRQMLATLKHLCRICRQFIR